MRFPAFFHQLLLHQKSGLPFTADRRVRTMPDSDVESLITRNQLSRWPVRQW